MLPTINGKSFLECTAEDLVELLDNPDFRENEYIDYKLTFSFLDKPRGNPEREKGISEFRSDVCAFANAGGGYLIYGISDVKGMAKEIVGIDIPNGNTDRFELDRKNNLSPIQPKLPSLQFRFIPLSDGKYVVIIYVHRDGYAPYVHLENEVNYRIFKRTGNGKTAVGYVEMKNMFNQSLSIEEEVQRFRQRRIDYYRDQEDTEQFRYSRFLLFHIIPDTFTDSSYKKNLFLLQHRQPGLKLHTIFNGTCCDFRTQPNVDGIRYPSNSNSDADCQLYNSGIAECFIPLFEFMHIDERYPHGRFPSIAIWERFEPVVGQYINVMKSLLDAKRIFLCVSILGCKHAVTENPADTWYPGRVDRNTIICNPVTIERIDSEDDIDNAMKWLQFEYLLSLGIKSSKTMTSLINELYDHNC